jgi:hypothetical protein
MGLSLPRVLLNRWAYHPVILNLIQVLLSASLDSGSSPDDGINEPRFRIESGMTG